MYGTKILKLISNNVKRTQETCNCWWKRTQIQSSTREFPVLVFYLSGENGVLFIINKNVFLFYFAFDCSCV